jgi:hypothetical protein
MSVHTLLTIVTVVVVGIVRYRKLSENGSTARYIGHTAPGRARKKSCWNFNYRRNNRRRPNSNTRCVSAVAKSLHRRAF